MLRGIYIGRLLVVLHFLVVFPSLASPSLEVWVTLGDHGYCEYPATLTYEPDERFSLKLESRTTRPLNNRLKTAWLRASCNLWALPYRYFFGFRNELNLTLPQNLGDHLFKMVNTAGTQPYQLVDEGTLTTEIVVVRGRPVVRISLNLDSAGHVQFDPTIEIFQTGVGRFRSSPVVEFWRSTRFAKIQDLHPYELLGNAADRDLQLDTRDHFEPWQLYVIRPSGSLLDGTATTGVVYAIIDPPFDLGQNSKEVQPLNVIVLPYTGLRTNQVGKAEHTPFDPPVMDEDLVGSSPFSDGNPEHLLMRAWKIDLPPLKTRKGMSVDDFVRQHFETIPHDVAGVEIDRALAAGTAWKPYRHNSNAPYLAVQAIVNWLARQSRESIEVSERRRVLGERPCAKQVMLESPKLRYRRRFR